MRKHILALLGAALVLVLGTPACSFPAVGGDSQPSSQGEPAEPLGSAVPVELAAEANTDGADTILIPGGTFWMGSEDWDAQAEPDEMPRHQVTLAGFRIYTHEVTNAMYARCVEADGCIEVEALPGGPTAHYADPAFADHPVSGVDWLMARDYCAWANSRLPTEAEWELASRSTDSLRFPWGDEDPTCERVNMFGCNVPPDTLSVGLLAGGNSAYDVWDLSGNVWEWVHDWYDESAYFFSSVVNPLGPNYGLTKVVRGGGLYSEPVMMRSAARQPADPNRTYDDVGFRCVPAPALALPESYYPVEEMHERVPPDLEGAGERAEEPIDPRGGWARFGEAVGSCPTDDGRLAIDFGMSYSCEDVSITVEVGGTPYSCAYDSARHVLHCEGDLPPWYAEGDPLGIILSMQCNGIHYGFGGLVSMPEDCVGEVPAIVLGARIDCPVDGMFAVTFEATPRVTWEMVHLVTSTEAVVLRCVAVSASETRCPAPDLSEGGFYRFDLHGVTEDGRDVNAPHWMMGVRTDCPPPERDTRVSIGCYGDHPSLQVWYTPTSPALESAAMDGSPLPCISTAPGAEICGNLTSAIGSEHTFTLCFEGEDCREWEDLPVPACPGSATEPGYTIEPTCYPPDAAGVSIHYWPFDQPLVDATYSGGVGASAGFLSCDRMGAGFYQCSGVSGAVGTERTITFCLGDGSCLGGPITVPDCSAPSSEDWRLATAGCHDEERIFFTVDTGLDWIVPGGAFTSRAADSHRSYACGAHPTIPGRLYCSGGREAGSGLQVCVQQTGAPSEMCRTFLDAIWISFEAGIPDCAPPPPPELAPCSSFTTRDECPTDRCVWWSTAQGACLPIPP